MPLALSGGPYIYRSFTAGTRASATSQLIAAMNASGWVTTGSSGTATGSRLRGTSPQGLLVDVDVWDPGSGSFIYVQFAYPTGRAHALRFGQNTQIVAHPCQIFISTVATNSAFDGNVACGGVPYIKNFGGGADPDCGAVGMNGEPVTECWWSGGDYQASGFGIAATNLRQSLDVAGSADADGRFNGTYSAAGGIGSSRIVSLSKSDVNSYYPIQYPDGSPLLAEPLVAFGDTGSGVIRVRGQLYDAMEVLENHSVDDASSVFLTTMLDQNYTWMNYVASGHALYLITSALSTVANDSYVY